MEKNEELKKLPTVELRKLWQGVWNIKPHASIGRTMLIKSIQFKRRQKETPPGPEMEKKLKQLVASYKRNPRCFDENIVGIKPGTRIVKIWKEKRHSVMVLENGFEYQDKTFTSLTEVARSITGTHWNGWVFFGLKKKKEAA